MARGFEPSVRSVWVMASAYRALLSVLAAMGTAFALSYASWNPLMGRYSKGYLGGVLTPIVLLLVVQVWLSAGAQFEPVALRSRARVGWATGVVLSSAILGFTWGLWLPEPRSAVFVVLWLPGLALLGLFHFWKWPELILTGLGPIALGVVLFVAEVPTLDFSRPIVNWGTPASFAYLFPREEPFFGPGGRLRPNLQARVRSGDYPGGTAIFTNADGFRSEVPIPRNREDGEYRILSLGDSFSCGYGASQTEFFGSLLQRRLQDYLGATRVRVLSAEVSDPACGLYYLQKWGAAFHPNLVVYGLSGNDVMQCVQFCGPDRRFRFGVDGRLEANPDYRDNADDLITEMRDWAYPAACPPRSLSLLRSRVAGDLGVDRTPSPLVFRLLAPLAGLAPQRSSVMPTMAQSYEAVDGRLRFIDGYANLGHYYLRAPIRTQDLTAPLWPLLRGLKSTARQIGASFLLVGFPQRYQVHRDDWQAMRTFWNLNDADFDLELFNRDLGQFCSRDGMDCLDLLDAFRDAGVQQALYLPAGDMHFNRAGHRLAGEKTAAFVADRYLGQERQRLEWRQVGGDYR